MFIFQNIRKAYINDLKEKLTDQNCEKRCPKVARMSIFLSKKGVFFTKKSRKIYTNSRKRLKYPLKLSQEDNFDDP